MLPSIKLRIGQMDRERQVEVAHILIGLSGVGRYFEELGDVLFFTVELRDAWLHIPLITFAGSVGGYAGNLHQIDFGKIVRVHRQSIADATRVIESNCQRAGIEIVRLHFSHVDTVLAALRDESGSHKLVGERRYGGSPIWATARHRVSQVDENFTLGRGTVIKHVQYPVSQGGLQDGLQ